MGYTHNLFGLFRSRGRKGINPLVQQTKNNASAVIGDLLLDPVVNATAAPSAVSTSASLGTYSASGGGGGTVDGTATPSAVSASWSVSASASGNGTATPSAVSTTAAVSATAKGDGRATPSAVSSTWSVSATASGAGTATPSAVTATGGLGSYSASGGTGAVDGTATPSAVGTSGLLGGYAATGGTGATANPTAVSSSSAVQSSAKGDGTASALAVGSSGGVAPVTANGAANALPSAVSSNASVQATATGGSSITVHSTGQFNARASQVSGSSRVFVADHQTRLGSYAAMGWGSHLLVQWIEKNSKKPEEPTEERVQTATTMGVFCSEPSFMGGSSTKQKRVGGYARVYAEDSWLYGESSTSDPELEEMLQVLLEIA